MGDDNMAPDLWRETWYYSNSSVYTFNTSASGNTTKKTSTRTTQLDWPLMREVDYNIETRLFNSIDLKVSYFDYLSSGQISNRNNLISAMSGGSEFLPQSNYGQTGLTGYEAQVSYNGRVKDFNYSIGGNFTYGKTKKIVTNELPDPNYTTIGDATDDIRGYHAIGFYSQEDINDMLVGTIATPTYMFAKDLKVGNIKYQDVNGDKLIDQYDKVVIGNTAPRIMYQGNLKLEYKGIELYAVVLGYGNYKPYLSNYFQNYTTRKYSSTITEGLPNGNVHPLLTAGSKLFKTAKCFIFILTTKTMGKKNKYE